MDMNLSDTSLNQWHITQIVRSATAKNRNHGIWHSMSAKNTWRAQQHPPSNSHWSFQETVPSMCFICHQYSPSGPVMKWNTFKTKLDWNREWNMNKWNMNKLTQWKSATSWLLHQSGISLDSNALSFRFHFPVKTCIILHTHYRFFISDKLTHAM